MKAPFLVGERIYLRALEREDAAIFHPWVNDQDVTRNLLLYRPMSLDAEEKFIERAGAPDGDIVLAIVLRRGDRVIGNIALHRANLKNRNAILGIMIGDKREWSRGYGTEAMRLIVGWGFDTLNLHRIWLTVYASNPRAIRCYEKIGFRLEGRLREQEYRDGRYDDVLAMGILRDEFEALRPKPRAAAAARKARPPRGSRRT